MRRTLPVWLPASVTAIACLPSAGQDKPRHGGLTDFDGIDMVPRQLDDVSTYPVITQELLNRGHAPEAIRKVLCENILRVLRANTPLAG